MFSAPLLAQDDLSNWDWTQFYVGAGGSLNRTAVDPESISILVNGVPQAYDGALYNQTGFVLAGASVQAGNFVLGLEGDMDFDPAVALGSAPCVGGTVPCGKVDILGSVDTLGNLRALVGYSPDPRVLVFGGVGMAAADVRIEGYSLETSVGTDSFNSMAEYTFSPPAKQRLIGLSLSAGAQFKATDNISFRAEIMHDAYGTIAVLDEEQSINSNDGSTTSSATMDTGGALAVSRTMVRTSVIVGF